MDDDNGCLFESLHELIDNFGGKAWPLDEEVRYSVIASW